MMCNLTHSVSNMLSPITLILSFPDLSCETAELIQHYVLFFNTVKDSVCLKRCV